MDKLKCIRGRRTATRSAILEYAVTRNRDEIEPENAPMILADFKLSLRELAAKDSLDMRQPRAERLGFFLQAQPVG